MKRRDWIKAGLATTMAVPCLSKLAVTAAERPAMLVDTHTHFYDPTRPEGVPWPQQDSPLYRKVMPADWKAVAAPQGVHHTVVVEASQWVEDNQWILDLAAVEPAIVGFVGNLNPHDANFSKHLQRFAENPIFRGIRWRSDLVPLDAQPGAVLAAARELAELDLQLDLNGPCQALPQAAQLAGQVPNLRIVINHLGASGDPQSLHPDWKANIIDLAKHPNVYMKVSALVEQIRGEVGQAPPQTEYYLPVLDHLWKHFGEDRLIYGSNWPVSDRGASYATLFNIVREYFDSKGQKATEKYFHRNSLAAYRWKQRG